jgi:hypothetical protein
MVHEYQGLLGAHAGGFATAWTDVRQQFATLRAKALPSEELEAHGLTGPSLALKLQLFESSVDDFLEELDQQEDAERYWRAWESRLRGSGWFDRLMHGWVERRREDVKRAGRNLLKGRLAKVLDTADVILDSLGQAVPVVGAAAGFISEFKDAGLVALGGPEEIDRLSRTPHESYAERGEGPEPTKPAGEPRTASGRLRRRKRTNR